MKEQSYLLSEAGITANLNSGKELLIEALLADNVICEDTARLIMTEYALIVVRKNWLGEMWDKLRGVKDDGAKIRVVKECRYQHIDIEEEK